MLLHPSIHLDPDVCGGLERTALAEVTMLEERGHEARLYVRSLRGCHPRVSRLTDMGWRNRLLRWPYYLQFLRLSRGADVLHGHYTPALVLLAPERSVVHLQGLAVTEVPLRRHFRVRCGRAHFICVAQHIADRFSELYPDIPEDHIHVLYNAADASLFVPGEKQIGTRPVRIGYHSLWAERKGVFDLLAATAAGAPARTCRGSRSASNACAK